VAVGPLDLAAGLDFIRPEIEQGFPWVSANIVTAAGKPIFQQIIRKKAGNIQLSITAVTAPPGKILKGIEVLSWESVLPSLLGQIRKENDKSFIIVLSNYSNEENIRIAKLFPEISLIIGADRRKGNISPKIVNNCLITQTAKQGKSQGVLDIRPGNNRHWGINSAEKLVNLQNKLGSLNWQLSRLEKKALQGEQENRRRKAVNRLQHEKEQLTLQIAGLKEAARKEADSGIRNDAFSYRFIALARKLPDDQATRVRVGELNKAIRALNKQKKQSAGRTQRQSGTSPSHNITGSDLCATCHTVQADFWKGTSHASAYETLVDKGRNFDIGCLFCHLTLNLKTAADTDMRQADLLSFPAELQAVGCETCHGPGKKHSIRPRQFHLVKTPSEELCLTCHTEEHDGDFNYLRKRDLISCPAG